MIWFFLPLYSQRRRFAKYKLNVRSTLGVVCIQRLYMGSILTIPIQRLYTYLAAVLGEMSLLLLFGLESLRKCEEVVLFQLESLDSPLQEQGTACHPGPGQSASGVRMEQRRQTQTLEDWSRVGGGVGIGGVLRWARCWWARAGGREVAPGWAGNQRGGCRGSRRASMEHCSSGLCPNPLHRCLLCWLVRVAGRCWSHRLYPPCWSSIRGFLLQTWKRFR